MSAAAAAALDGVAVVTIAHGRHEHLRHQLRGLAAGQRPGHFVLVAMGDPGLVTVLHGERPPAGRVLVRELPPTGSPGADLPLSEARNLGAETAICAGADVLVFLDVDCIPSPSLVARYAQVAREAAAVPTPVVLCGEVGYLPPGADPAALTSGDLRALARAHPARPTPAHGTVLDSDRFDLFWSLSFAMTARHWRAVGGFCEEYVGYGGEDTDFGQRVAAAGGTLRWVGGAEAYHQYHPSSSPPVEHLAAILRNANIFRRRWGWFPMGGWLQEFERLGLAEPDADGRRWSARRDAASPR